MTALVIFTWDGDVMVPQARFRKLCDRQFAVHQSYTLIVHEERSSASHRQYFAAINEVWNNLPEIHADRWRTTEHLRKWALVQAGYRVEKTVVAASKADALRIAAFIEGIDEFAVVTVRDKVVAHYTAKSQSMAAMDRKEFQESKQAVLDVVAKLIGVDANTLSAQSSPSLAPAHVPDRTMVKERV